MIVETLTVTLTSAALFVYYLTWLTHHKELKNQLEVQKEIAKHSHERIQDHVKAMREELDTLRSEMNGVNFKLGLKLK